jgi:DNA-binding NarL/FixJ family response regulator
MDAQPASVRQNAPGSSLIAYFAGTERERERNCAKASLASGFRGLLTKQARSHEIATAISLVSRGGYYVEGSFGDIMLQSRIEHTGGKPARAQLTERETYVLQSVARGMSMKEIGGELDLSSKTIETYKARASSKLNLQSRRDIVEYAIRSGWIQSQA